MAPPPQYNTPHLFISSLPLSALSLLFALDNTMSVFLMEFMCRDGEVNEASKRRTKCIGHCFGKRKLV